MKRVNRIQEKLSRLRLSGHGFIFLILLIANIAHAQQDSLTVIANHKGAPKAMSFKELKAVFKGEKKRWRDGTKIVITLMKTSTPAGAMTTKKVYQMATDELNRYWVTMVFRGQAKAPRSVDSEEELVKFVTKTPGAIGVVSSGPIDSSTTRVSIDGKTIW